MTFELISKLAATRDAVGSLVLSWVGTGHVLQVSPAIGPGVTGTASTATKWWNQGPP